MFYTEELRKEFGDKYNFLQVYSVVFSKSENLTTITFLFDEKVKEITDEQREELQNQLNDANEQLDGVQSELSENLQQVQKLDEKISTSQQELDELNTKIADLQT